jgi:hypothetical protein
VGHDANYGGWSFVGGIDLGIKHDHTAFVILGVKSIVQRIRLCWAQSWKPPRGGQVDLMSVERHIVEQHGRFHLQKLPFDPHQAQLMAARLHRRGMLCEEVGFVGTNLNRMATVLMEVFRSQIIDLYDTPPHGKQLVRDLGRITIEEKAYGQRLTAVADADGHADLATQRIPSRHIRHSRCRPHQLLSGLCRARLR